MNECIELLKNTFLLKLSSHIISPDIKLMNEFTCFDFCFVMLHFKNCSLLLGSRIIMADTVKSRIRSRFLDFQVGEHVWVDATYFDDPKVTPDLRYSTSLANN